MSKAFIKALSSALKKASIVQELLLRQKPTEDIAECLECMDSISNTLHGLREEEKEIARFEGNFLESRFEEEEEEEDE